jgi:hypothetical protein
MDCCASHLPNPVLRGFPTEELRASTCDALRPGELGVTATQLTQAQLPGHFFSCSFTVAKGNKQSSAAHCVVPLSCSATQ